MYLSHLNHHCIELFHVPLNCIKVLPHGICRGIVSRYFKVYHCVTLCYSYASWHYLRILPHDIFWSKCLKVLLKSIVSWYGLMVFPQGVVSRYQFPLPQLSGTQVFQLLAVPCNLHFLVDTKIIYFTSNLYSTLVSFSIYFLIIAQEQAKTQKSFIVIRGK